MGLIVVLVRTHSPGNLGAAARAAKNFGATLVLCDPKADRAHPDARAFASGAEDTLDQAEILSSMDEVSPRCDRLVALSSLRGRVERGLPPATTWPALRSSVQDLGVALVFGPERGGLTTDELRRCGSRLAIPTRPELPTMNLAQAVAATLALATMKQARRAAVADVAPDHAITRALDALHAVLAKANYPAPGHARGVLAELDSLIRRAKPTDRELKLLRGAIAALDRKLT